VPICFALRTRYPAARHHPAAHPGPASTVPAVAPRPQQRTSHIKSAEHLAIPFRRSGSDPRLCAASPSHFAARRD
jgi:hypothetical protein